MDTLDAIRARRNVRLYTDEPLTADELREILEAGRRSPSASNWQPWDFVVVTDRAQLEALSKVWQGAWHAAGSAATIALTAAEPADERRALLQYDLGQATANIMLAATALGIGSGHALVADHDQAKEVLGLPEGRFCAYLIALGRPADRPLKPIERPDRRPLSEIVHWNRW
jgi:nitroreductase